MSHIDYYWLVINTFLRKIKMTLDILAFALRTPIIPIKNQNLFPVRYG